MKDFSHQLEEYGKQLRNTRYPYSEAELDREIRKAIWNTEPRQAAPALPRKRRWPIAAVAAIVVAFMIPTVFYISNTHAAVDIDSVEVDGQHIYFACNNGCTADATIETFKNLLR